MNYIWDLTVCGPCIILSLGQMRIIDTMFSTGLFHIGDKCSIHCCSLCCRLPQSAQLSLHWSFAFAACWVSYTIGAVLHKNTKTLLNIDTAICIWLSVSFCPHLCGHSYDLRYITHVPQDWFWWVCVPCVLPDREDPPCAGRSPSLNRRGRGWACRSLGGRTGAGWWRPWSPSPPLSCR